MPKRLSELPAPCVRQPIARPGRRQHLIDDGIVISLLDPARCGLRGGWLSVAGHPEYVGVILTRTLDRPRSTSFHRNRTHDPEIHDAQNRDLWIHNRFEDAPGRDAQSEPESFGATDAMITTAHARVSSLQVLHLGKHVPQMLSVHSALAVPLVGNRCRPNQRGLLQDFIDPRRPERLQCSQFRRQTQTRFSPTPHPPRRRRTSRL